GMLLVGPDGEHERIPAVPRDVFDVSGAGDIVTATVAACLAAEASESEAARVANFAASVEVGKAGVASVSAEEIVEAFEGERHRRENLALHEPGS
ncbi:MAG: PfkB family carbohydrate kinase, partial [Gemmatimonadota bacterium]